MQHHSQRIRRMNIRNSLPDFSMKFSNASWRSNINSETNNHHERQRSLQVPVSRQLPQIPTAPPRRSLHQRRPTGIKPQINARL